MLTLPQMAKFKAFADDQNRGFQQIDICFWEGTKHCGKWRKCCLPTFSPFPTMFSKACFTRAVKTRGCLGNGLNVENISPEHNSKHYSAPLLTP